MAHSRFAKNTESGKAPQHPAAPRTQTETGDRGNGFDFIRYVLAFVVAVAHFYGLTDTPRQGWWMTSGDAVSGFFVLSGFLVFRSFQRQPDWRRYARRRLCRVVPPYLFIVLLCVVAGAFLTEWPTADYLTSEQTYRYLLANVFFLNFLEPSLPGVFSHNALTAVNGALWTMKVELLLYATVPLVAACLRRWRPAVVLTAIFLLSFLYAEGLDALYDATGNAVCLMLKRQFVSQLVYFYAGTAALLYFAPFQRNAKWLLPLALFVYIARHAWGCCAYLYPFALAALIVGTAFHVPCLRFASRVSNISYSIYLFHFPVIQTVLSFGLHQCSFWGALVLSLTLTVLLAACSWKFVEKPWLRLARR